MKRGVMAMGSCVLAVSTARPAFAQTAPSVAPPVPVVAPPVAAPTPAVPAPAPAALPVAPSSAPVPVAPELRASDISDARPPVGGAVVQAPGDPRRRTGFVPQPVKESDTDMKIRFEADPVGDGALLIGVVGFSVLTEFVLSTGEIRPQQIDASFDTGKLLGIDQTAIKQTIDPHAGTYSTIGLGAAIVFAAIDPVLTGFRDGKEAALVDAFMYAEAATTAWALSDIAKVAVRRPRPIAYIDRKAAIAAGANPATYDNTSTDSSLSFFSGHAAVTSSIASAATYIAFARAPHTARPWITLIAGVALTSFVGFERVRAGAHFPTDVIAGALAGTGAGLLTVHLHREDTVQQRPVWVGFTPVNGGGTANLGGKF